MILLTCTTPIFLILLLGNFSLLPILAEVELKGNQPLISAPPVFTLPNSNEGNPNPEELILKPFLESTGRDIQQFSTVHLMPRLSSFKTVFYPFGGPDILYPNLLLPHAERLVLVGLEPPGKISPPEKDNLTLIHTLLEKSFFITADMWHLFNPTHGVLPALLYQIKIIGGTDTEVEVINKPINGVKIKYTYHGIEKEIYYYQSNLDNNHLNQDFINFIRENGFMEMTLLKATSYLPHQSGFSKVRDFIAQNSQAVVQNDSGLPYTTLKNHFKKIQFYGNYHSPYGKEFAHHTQKDLEKVYAEGKSEAVPFCFGYGCRRIDTNLIVAVKEKEEER